MFEECLKVGSYYIPLSNCPISMQSNDQEDLQSFGTHHLGIGLVIVDSLFLCESSANFSGFIFFDGPVRPALDDIYPLSVHDLGADWNI